MLIQRRKIQKQHFFSQKSSCNLKTSTIKRFLYIIFIFSSIPDVSLKIDPSPPSSFVPSKEDEERVWKVVEKEETGFLTRTVSVSARSFKFCFYLWKSQTQFVTLGVVWLMSPGPPPHFFFRKHCEGSLVFKRYADQLEPSTNLPGSIQVGFERQTPWNASHWRRQASLSLHLWSISQSSQCPWSFVLLAAFPSPS